MIYPDFFDAVPTITLQDPLSDLLGTFDGGLVTFGYLDIVKSAGHSCPTVAGAYLMALHGLKLLYPDTLPLRGTIRVMLKEPVESGSAGVTANVLAQITGAAAEGGFKGLNGRFCRRGLLEFGADISADVRMMCEESGMAVDCYYRPQAVASGVELQKLMLMLNGGSADAETLSQFGKLWQERVRRILIEECGNPELLRIEAVKLSAFR